MVQFKKIVLTTDLSECANAAIPYAVEFARRYDGTIFLVHVAEEDLFVASMAYSPSAMAEQSKWTAEARQNREQKLSDLAKSLGKREGVSVVNVMLHGNAVNMIVNFAKANADCIVIATHGRTGFSHLMYGSVAERVIRLSHCPVLAVRPQAIAAK